MSALSMNQHASATRIGSAGLGLLVCMLVWGPPLSAQELKVGFVNVAKIFDGYTKTQTLDTKLEQKGTQKEAELKGRVEELKKLRKSLELLNNEARENRVLEIEKKSDDLQRFRTSTARDLRRERDKMAKGIFQEIQDGVTEYAKANGYTLIMNSQSLAYGEQGHDLTDAVLAVLNERAR